MKIAYRYHAELSWLEDGRVFSQRRNDIGSVNDGRKWVNTKLDQLVAAGAERVIGEVVATSVAPDASGAVRVVDKPTIAHHVESPDWKSFDKQHRDNPDTHRVFTVNRAEGSVA